MRRGEVWTSSGAPDYGGKPRPVVIVQDDLYPTINSVTVCPLTSDPTFISIRFEVQPSARNGLVMPSRMMVDKVATFQRSKLGRRIGELDPSDIIRMNRALITFLGLSQAPSLSDEP